MYLCVRACAFDERAQTRWNEILLDFVSYLKEDGVSVCRMLVTVSLPFIFTVPYQTPFLFYSSLQNFIHTIYTFMFGFHKRKRQIIGWFRQTDTKYKISLRIYIAYIPDISMLLVNTRRTENGILKCDLPLCNTVKNIVFLRLNSCYNKELLRQSGHYTSIQASF